MEVPNIELTMKKDECLISIEPNPTAKTKYVVQFKDGKTIGDNFANVTDLFINKNPTKCPFKTCIVN